MIGRNYKYNGLDLSPSKVYDTKIALTDVEHMTDQRTEIVNNVNDHWSISSNTLESGRLIVFDGYVFGITKTNRGTGWELLNSHINIEPYVNKDPFKKLEFKTDKGEDRWLLAKVNEKPKGANGMNDSRIKFSFSLYSNSNEVYSANKNIVTNTTGGFGGTSFPNTFWDSWWDMGGLTSCINDWNFRAWCIIQCTHPLVNPKIRNLTNWQVFKINWSTSNLILDSTGGAWSVADAWVNIMNKRDYWVPIYLSPWDNYIIVSDDTGVEVGYSVSWYDTWNTV